jgi:purine-binding chemotaxis protein CheW
MSPLPQPAPTADLAPEAVRLATRPPRECLTFRLGHEEYAIDILRVQEIRSYEAPTRIANAPSFVKGVVNLRGVIVPIVDLRLKFGHDAPRYDGSTVTVVLTIANRVIGVVVDSVSDVIELANDDIRPAPEFNAQVDASHIVGLGTVRSGDAERMLILVDIEKLMSSAEIGLFNTLH